MKITRPVTELLPDTIFTAALDIPEEPTPIAGGKASVYVCELSGLEDFCERGDHYPFTLHFGSPEAAEDWFFSKWGIRDYIEQQTH